MQLAAGFKLKFALNKIVTSIIANQNDETSSKCPYTSNPKVTCTQLFLEVGSLTLDPKPLKSSSMRLLATAAAVIAIFAHGLDEAFSNSLWRLEDYDLSLKRLVSRKSPYAYDDCHILKPATFRLVYFNC